MRLGRVLGAALAIAWTGAGCAAQARRQGAPEAAAQVHAGSEGHQRFADPSLSFALECPIVDWRFESGARLSSERVVVPVVVVHAGGAAHVVLQVARPEVSALLFADRLLSGLRHREGFRTSEVEPISLAEGALGFSFAFAEEVDGRVAILSDERGLLYVMLATWPRASPPALIGEIDQIVGSFRLLGQ